MDLQLPTVYPPELVEAHHNFVTRFHTSLPISLFAEEFWEKGMKQSHRAKVDEGKLQAYGDAEDKLEAHKEEMDRVSILKISSLLAGKDLTACEAIMKNTKQLLDVVNDCTQNLPACGSAIDFLKTQGHTTAVDVHMELAVGVVDRMRAVWKDYRDKGIQTHQPTKFEHHFQKHMRTVDTTKTPSSRSQVPGLEDSRVAQAIPPLRTKRYTAPARGPASLVPLQAADNAHDYAPHSTEDGVGGDWYSGSDGSDFEYSDSGDELTRSTQQLKDDDFGDMPPLRNKSAQPLPDQQGMPKLRQRGAHQSVPDLKVRGQSASKPLPSLGSSIGQETSPLDSSDSCSTAVGWLEKYLQKNKKSISNKNLVYFAPADEKLKPMVAALDKIGGGKGINPDGIIDKHLCVDEQPASPIALRAFKPLTNGESDYVFVTPASTIAHPIVEEPNLVELRTEHIAGFSIRIVKQNNLFNYTAQ